ncbi:uncharacterized protein [Oscarella lobularis]|uniref:uncharacterized protein n=1 Tax=Oscarella lobularis TaxID=121494 RepID=UPI003313D10E
MDERWNTHVRPFLPDLLQILLPLALIDRFYAVALITLEEFEKIKTYDNTEGSRTLLVSILPRKGPDSFDRFLCVLKKTEGQEHVAKLIMKTKRTNEYDKCTDRVESEKIIKELERELKKEKEERAKEKQESKKDKVTIIGLRNKIGPSMESWLKWETSKQNMPLFDCYPYGRVAEINGILHVGSGKRMLQLKEGAWEGETHHLDFKIGSVFECEGKGYVMDGGGPFREQCTSIYEWKSETRHLELLTEIPNQYRLKYRSAIGHNGKIYLVGGGKWGSDEIDCFDISKREWKPIKRMKNKRWHCSLAVIDDKMFVWRRIGGGTFS